LSLRAPCRSSLHHPAEHLAHRARPLGPVRHRPIGAGREGRPSRHRRRDRGREPRAIRDRDTRIDRIAESRDRGRDHRASHGLVLVQLDRVEAVGERVDDVRHDEHVGVLQVPDHLLAAAGAEQARSGGLEAPHVVGA